MTTSISNAQAETLSRETERAEITKPEAPPEVVRTIASRFIILILCLAIVLSTLAYGTVHSWSLAVFAIGAALIIFFWAVDAWRSQKLRLSRNPLQLPLAGLILVGLIQLLPLGGPVNQTTAVGVIAIKSLSLDPYATRVVIVQLISLFVYFAAALAFTDSPRRLRLVARTIVIFGFFLAIFGIIQNFTSPTKIYWLRELPQSTAFGPFINRHHFAGYMELTIALALGLLFSGAIEREQRLLYIFASAMMGIALVLTQSRGGLVSFVAEVFFIVALTGLRWSKESEDEDERRARARTGVLRVGIAFGLVTAFLVGAVLLGGEPALSRAVGTINLEDPTTGRAYFWKTTLQIIRDHPFMGIGLGAFGVTFTRYDTHGGQFRLEQAHNDYLQILSDAGIIGALLGFFFIAALFRMGFARMGSKGSYRRGLAIGALAGCFAVLVHSFFDFTLHTTSNALLFLILAALATLGNRVEEETRSSHHHHRHRRRRHHTIKQPDFPIMAGKRVREALHE